MRIHALLLLVACHAAPRPPAPPAVHAAAVEQLVGVWQGDALDTPFGDFPFAIAFDREPGGDVHGRLQASPQMYLDFRFRRQGARWVLVEEGALTGQVQSQTLQPVAGAAARWGEARLAVELAVDRESLVWTTWLGGDQHSKFQMRRVRGPAADQVREAIRKRGVQ